MFAKSDVNRTEERVSSMPAARVDMMTLLLRWVRRPSAARRMASLTLACALAACDSTKPTQSASGPVVTASASKAESPPARSTARAMTTMTSKEVRVKSDGVELMVTLHTSRERIVVEYVINNRGRASVYLTDVALDPKTAGLKLDALRVDYFPPNAAILSSRLGPLDPTLSWVHPPSAYVTRVAPGETFKGTLAAEAPLRAQGVQPQLGPSGERDMWAGAVVECAQIRFDLGVVSDSPDLDARPLTVAGKTVYRIGPAAFRLQRVISVAIYDLSVPLITK